jgi:biotin carboxyl carrier protein
MSHRPTALRAIVEGETFEIRVEAESTVSVATGSGSGWWSAVVRETGTGPPLMLTVIPRPDDSPVRAQVAFADDVAWVFVDGEVFEIELAEATEEAARRRDRGAHDALAAPMPATVTRILVEPGQQVAHGDTLVLLEAMKMELPVRAPHDARIARIRCRPGELVQPGEPLIDLDEPT